MNITVFSGMSRDNSAKGLAHCREIGEIIATNGYTMICAGASLGCQNELIEGALSKGGKVIAVSVPRFRSELREELVSNSIIASGSELSERKKIMKEKSKLWLYNFARWTRHMSYGKLFQKKLKILTKAGTNKL